MHRKTAFEIHESFMKGEFTAQEIVQYFLNRIDKHDKDVGSYLKVYHKKALEKAKALDQKKADGKPLGKMAGVPVGIKDNIHIKGEITTCASKILENYTAPFDATVVKLLEEEDAILMGKTNLDEFAMGGATENSAFQTTRNPWDLKCTPGGSSGGSSACVTARLTPIALGSDTGGSVRQPGGYCGIAGFKPTYGRVSRYGIAAFGSSLDQIGPMAYDARDTAMIMEVIAKHCEHDATSIEQPTGGYLNQLKEDFKGVKIGVPFKFLEDLPKESLDLFNKSMDLMKSKGAEIIDVDLTLLKHSIDVYYILATAEASTNLARYDGIRYGYRSKGAKNLDEIYDLSREEGFGFEVKRRVMLGTYVLASGFMDAYYKKAQKIRTLIIRKFSQAFAKCDLICMPSTAEPAFELHSKQDPLKMYLVDLYTTPANLAGLPAISVPCGMYSNNMPYGIQFFGPQLHDAEVIGYAHAFEKALGQSFMPPIYGDANE